MSTFRALKVRRRIFLLWDRGLSRQPWRAEKRWVKIVQALRSIEKWNRSPPRGWADDTFQQANPEMGDCQGSFDAETKINQPAMDTARMEVKVQGGKFHRFWRERLQVWRWNA